MEAFIKEENENINTEGYLEDPTVNINMSGSTTVKEFKEETEETEDPPLVISG